MRIAGVAAVAAPVHDLHDLPWLPPVDHSEMLETVAVFG
jgi:hypothetical protein